MSVLRSCAVLVIAGMAAACGGEKQAASSGPPPNARRVDTAAAGQVTGRVVLDGPAPASARIDMSSDRNCASQNPGATTSENFVVDGGALENVFVYVKDGLGDYYFDVPADPVKLDQQGCRYVPHVLGVRAGQPLAISNSDDTMHNVHAMAKTNQPFNKGQHLKNMVDTKVFAAREVMVPFKCDVHNWMQAYVGVLDHPYFDVTHGGGRFELKTLPAGTYTVEAWHEKLGTQTQTVTIGPKESKEITFTYRAPAAAAN